MAGSIEKILSAGSTRVIADIAIGEIEKNPELFIEAWELTLRDRYPISMRAARVVDESAEKNSELIEPFLDELIRKLPEFNVDGVKRGFLRYFVNKKPRLNASQRGYLLNVCLDLFNSASSSTAIRFYSLSILYELSKKEKWLKPELLSAIEESIARNKFTNEAYLLKIRNKLYKEMPISK